MQKNKKVALVTGGAVRVGAKITEFLYNNGYDVIITYDKSSDAAEILKNCSIVKEALKIDFVKDQNFLEQIQNIGKIDLLINNAAIFEKEDGDFLDFELLTRHFTVNSFVPIMLADMMYKQEHNSHIINILDSMTEKVGEGFFSYYLSKRLLFEATKMQAVRYMPKIRINGISPKILMINQRQSQEHFENMIKELDDCPDPIQKLLDSILYLENSDLTGEIL